MTSFPRAAFLLFILASLASPLPAQARSLIPLRFEANQGQSDSQVKFLAKGGGSTLFLTPSDAVLALKAPGGRDVLRLRFLGGNPSPSLEGLGALAARSSYFIGKDPSAWRTNIPNFSEVKYKGLYRGVDVVFHAGGGNVLEYDFKVAPGSDPKVIALDFTGAKSVRIDRHGALRIAMPNGFVVQPPPDVYQTVGTAQRKIRGSYVLKGPHRVGLKIAAYDKTRPLVIDPVLTYATYLGGDGDDAALAIARDAAGILYVTGRNGSSNFPVQGGFLGDQNVEDVLVAVLDPSQSGAAQLLYSVNLGGNGEEAGYGIRTDGTGVIYLAGRTASTDFPVMNAFQTTAALLEDAFFAKLDPSQTGAAQLVYSTYIGGDGDDSGFALDIDGAGRAFVTGYSRSSNFPVTGNAFQGTLNGTADAFITEIDPSQSGSSSLIYSTYLGGSADDYGEGIDVDSNGIIYVSGASGSTDYPVTNGFQPGFGDGSYDGVLVKLDPSQSGSAQILYATFLGGGGDDDADGVAVDDSGKADVAGYTKSTDFPVRNEIAGDPGDNDYDAFLAEVDTTQSGDASLLYSTYLSGGGDDEAFAVARDPSGRVAVTGFTSSTDFPTVNPISTDPGDNDYDVFVSRIDPTRSGSASLLFSTYLGGNGDDEAFGMTTDSSCNIYVAAYTTSSDDPTVNAFQGTYSGVPGDGFVAVISQDGPPAITSALTASGSVGKNFSYTITSDGNTPIAFSASPLPDGLSLSGDTITGTPTTEGVTNVHLTAVNQDCADSATLVVNIAASSGGGCSLIRAPSITSKSVRAHFGRRR